MRAIDADKLPVQKIYHVDEGGYGATFYMVDVEDIKAAPTITYEDLVPHGRWVKQDDYYCCSNCGQAVADECCSWFKHCPNCGAKMDGGNDNGF